MIQTLEVGLELCIKTEKCLLPSHMMGFNVGLLLLFEDDRIAPHAIAKTFKGTSLISPSFFIKSGMGDAGGVDLSTISSISMQEILLFGSTLGK